MQTVDQFAQLLAWFEERNSLWRHFDSGSGFWIASDAPSSLARLEASESTDVDLVPGSQGTDDAVEYGADDNVGFLQGHSNGLVDLVGQIGPGHLAHRRRITKKPITALPAAAAGASAMVGHSQRARIPLFVPADPISGRRPPPDPANQTFDPRFAGSAGRRREIRRETAFRAPHPITSRTFAASSEGVNGFSR